MELLSSTHHDGHSQVWSTRPTLRQSEYHKPYCLEQRSGKGGTCMSKASINRERENSSFRLGRREFIMAGLALATTAMFPRTVFSAGTPAAQPMVSDHRKLGALEVSSIGLGCMNVAWGFGPPIDKRDAVKLIRHALRTRGNVL